MASTALSRLLRDLRRSHWSGQTLTQGQVAQALGVTIPSISSYENGVVPPEDRLRDYAVLFASPRWLEPEAPARLSLELLRPDERAVHDALVSRIQAATRSATLKASSFWRFPDDDAPIRIFVARLDADEVGPLGDLTNHNYTFLQNAADLDSLSELLTHLSRLNPGKNIEYKLGNDFSDDDLGAHMVVLGNIARTQGAGRLIPEGTLPVRQVAVDDLDGEVFEFERDGKIVQFRPFIAEHVVVEDIGLLARRSNPHDSRRTLTVCSGVFSRGVLGAVRILSKENLRDDNAMFLQQDIKDSDSFALLFRVKVAGENVVTPRLQAPDAILYSSSPIEFWRPVE
jgi:transcriptional regulator with XRE-family HTH domain